MKTTPEPDDRPLRNLLGAARPEPPLPPGFQESVWRRLDGSRAPQPNRPAAVWLDRLAEWLLRPGPALAGIAAMLAAGTVIGVVQGANLAGEVAKQRYLGAVSPYVLR